jgi:hypothetical protein
MGVTVTCLQPGCDRSVHSRGVCSNHYIQMNYGSIPDLRLPPRTRSIPKVNGNIPAISWSLDGKKSVVLFAEKLIRLLEIKASQTTDPQIMAGYLGAMQATKLLALTVDPSALPDLTQEVNSALSRMRNHLSSQP